MTAGTRCTDVLSDMPLGGRFAKLRYAIFPLLVDSTESAAFFLRNPDVMCNSFFDLVRLE